MILQALHGLGEREDLLPDPDYQDRPVAWLVTVGPGGRLLGIQGTHYTPLPQGRRKPRPVAKTYRIPRRQESRSGISPPAEFFVDNALYVFGISVDGKYAADKARGRADMFLETVRECWEETCDEGVKAVLDLLDAVADRRQPVDLTGLDPPCRSNDLFAFVYAPDVDLLVTDRPKVEAYWRRRRRKTQAPPAGAVRCLVTGRPCVPVGKHRKLKHVPQKGGAGDIALIPLGSPSNMFESYGWKKNENAPISADAAEMCATALNRLLHPAFPDPHQPGQTMARRNLRISADTVVCYWSATESGDQFCDMVGPVLEAADPEQVGEAYRSLWRGRPVPIEDTSAFYALTLTGQQGRAIVRDWFESTLQQVSQNLAAHFRDLRVVRNARPRDGTADVPLGVRALMEAVAQPAERRSEGVPPHLAAQFVRAAFAGTPYPLGLLQRAVLRFRAEIGKETQNNRPDRRVRNWNDARAAIIKAVLNRCVRARISQLDREVKPEMDPTNRSEGYVLGQLMAVFERLQQLAIGDPNASVVDRYFSGASASPKSVFVRLYKNARHHARKAREGESAGFAFRLERLIDELSAAFGLSERAIHPERNALPAFLSQEQQGLFVLGYHHMRRWLWMNREERTAWEGEHPDAPRAYLWRDTHAAADVAPEGS